MATDLTTLEQRALALMQAQDFGDEAVRVNAEIVELDPKRIAAWTRLGRCHMEARRFDEAIDALRAALALNPSSGVATNLLNDVRKRRALTPTAAERAVTGFGVREFTALATLSPADALEALKPRVDALLDSLNASGAAAKIVEARQRGGESASRLFHANSAHPAAGNGHIYAFHYGGRWEPQFNIGWFASPPGWPVNCVRAGIGFNTSAAGRDPDRGAGQERIVRYFERFQRVLAKSWRNELARWMSRNAGFIQYGEKPAALDLLPEQAVERLLTCQNAAAVEWIFIGRWWFLDKAEDAAVLRDRAALARTIDDTFRALLPIWLSVYAGSD
jgi:tetratricopeptide (TPR) repeat protein